MTETFHLRSEQSSWLGPWAYCCFEIGLITVSAWPCSVAGGAVQCNVDCQIVNVFREHHCKIRYNDNAKLSECISTTAYTTSSITNDSLNCEMRQSHLPRTVVVIELQVWIVLMYYFHCLFMFGSKHQLVKPITCSMKLKAVEQLLLQRQNFDFLQTPYLTEVCDIVL